MRTYPEWITAERLIHRCLEGLALTQLSSPARLPLPLLDLSLYRTLYYQVLFIFTASLWAPGCYNISVFW